MSDTPAGPLQPQLAEAKETLVEALGEACSSNVFEADTGELIRIEEMLAIAGDAAKRVVSIRRKLRDSSEPDEEVAAGSMATELEVAAPDAHRRFQDARGVTWDAFAVHPAQEGSGRAQLPEPYRAGWLVFDSEREKRRLSPVPPEWHLAGEEELRTLCGRAEIVPARRL
ncbi:MAG TPA: hypothetical protein VGD77_14620 [Gemmatimonadaceae bacterium]